MRGVNRIPWWVWPITAALLIIATFDLPYGYYTILRIVVCGFAVVVFFHTWEQRHSLSHMAVDLCGDGNRV